MYRECGDCANTKAFAAWVDEQVALGRPESEMTFGASSKAPNAGLQRTRLLKRVGKPANLPLYGQTAIRFYRKLAMSQLMPEAEARHRQRL
jgi:hypothetical protein